MEVATGLLPLKIMLRPQFWVAVFVGVSEEFKTKAHKIAQNGGMHFVISALGL